MTGLMALNVAPAPALPQLQNRFPPLNQPALQQQASNFASPAEAQVPQIEAPDARVALSTLDPSSGAHPQLAGQPAPSWAGLMNALVQGVGSPFLHLLGLGGGSAPAAPAGGVLGAAPGWGLNTAFSRQPMTGPPGGVLDGPFDPSPV